MHTSQLNKVAHFDVISSKQDAVSMCVFLAWLHSFCFLLKTQKSEAEEMG